MYLQGDLQKLFDVLYGMGVIDPVLEKDWGEALDELPNYIEGFDQVIRVVNTHQSDLTDLQFELEKFDQVTLEYLAMEVAREFADFHTREALH